MNIEEYVHGDIRHLEIISCSVIIQPPVHGDIRHLEIIFSLDNKRK